MQWGRRGRVAWAGTWRERLGAGLLSIALHIAIVLPAILVGALAEQARHPAHPLNPQLRVMLVLIVVPGLALAVGAAPFLRRRVQASEDALEASAS